MIGERLYVRREANDPKENADQNRQPANRRKKLPAPRKEFAQWFDVFAVRQSEHSKTDCDHGRPPTIEHVSINEQWIFVPRRRHPQSSSLMGMDNPPSSSAGIF